MTAPRFLASGGFQENKRSISDFYGVLAESSTDEQEIDDFSFAASVRLDGMKGVLLTGGDDAIARGAKVYVRLVRCGRRLIFKASRESFGDEESGTLYVLCGEGFVSWNGVITHVPAIRPRRAVRAARSANAAVGNLADVGDWREDAYIIDDGGDRADQQLLRAYRAHHLRAQDTGYIVTQSDVRSNRHPNPAVQQIIATRGNIGLSPSPAYLALQVMAGVRPDASESPDAWDMQLVDELSGIHAGPDPPPNYVPPTSLGTVKAARTGALRLLRAVHHRRLGRSQTGSNWLPRPDDQERQMRDLLDRIHREPRFLEQDRIWCHPDAAVRPAEFAMTGLWG